MEIYKNYILDLISLIVEKAEETKLELSEETNDEERTYIKGKLYSYFEILDLIKSQSKSFGLNDQDIGVDKIVPEKYLTAK